MEGLKLLYPLKFVPVYKDYIWGGRNLEKLGKNIPEGIIAESWELSCHPEGESIISNGLYRNKSLTWFIEEHGYKAVGTSVGSPSYWQPGDKFPLLIKFIDANDRLSVQVHPDDRYALLNEDDKSGKNEMWYIIWAKPGAKLVYGLIPGTTKEEYKAKYFRDIQPAIDRIELYPEINTSISELSKLCNMSESSFRRKFKQYTNDISPINYRNRIRIMKAEELCNNSSYTIEEAAMKLGFCDAAHLCRLYKQFTGKTLKTR
jgi:mannose-6-phosphate isomerase class I